MTDPNKEPSRGRLWKSDLIADAPEPRVASVECSFEEGSIALFMAASCGRCHATEVFTTTSASHGSGRLKTRGWSLSFDGVPICYDCVTDLLKHRHDKVKSDRLIAERAEARERIRAQRESGEPPRTLSTAGLFV